MRQSSSPSSLKDSSSHWAKFRMETNTKDSGVLRVKEMASATACVRTDEPSTKGTGVTAWCMAREGTWRLMDFTRESSQTTNGKALASISSLREMCTRASGNMAKGVEQVNFTSKLKIVSSKGILRMENAMGTEKFWTVMGLECWKEELGKMMLRYEIIKLRNWNFFCSLVAGCLSRWGLNRW